MYVWIMVSISSRYIFSGFALAGRWVWPTEECRWRGPWRNLDVCDVLWLSRHLVSQLPLAVTQHKNLYLMMQLDCVSKLLPTASARVSDIQLLQALWRFSQISLFLSPSGRQHSHFHTKLSRHFCWQKNLKKEPTFFFFNTFLISPHLKKKKSRISFSQLGVRREVQAADKTRWALQTSLDEGVPFRQAEIKLLSFGLEKLG